MSKRVSSLILAVILALTALASFACAESVPEETTTYYVYTENGKPLNVRDEPGGEIIGQLPYGEAVQIISEVNENWAIIPFQDATGYVNRRFLIPIQPDVLVKAMQEEQEGYTGDPLADIDNEFASVVDVDDYKISVRPARVTSMVNMRWIPSETGRVIAQYKATETLVVLKELKNYLQVQDPDTGDVGYIHKKFAAR